MTNLLDIMGSIRHYGVLRSCFESEFCVLSLHPFANSSIFILVENFDTYKWKNITNSLVIYEYINFTVYAQYKRKFLLSERKSHFKLLINDHLIN